MPSVTFTYVVPPTIAIGSPGLAASYTQHQVVTSGYSCTPGAGTTVASCVGPVASGVQLDTSSVGQHTFTVSASDADGGTATASATYTVTSPPPPPPPPSKPQLSHIGDAGGQSHAGKATFTFTLNESARVTFTFVRKVSGRKVKGHCVTPTRENLHKPKCTFTQSSKVTVSGRTGSNTLNLTVKKLPAGHYTVTITATDTAGHVSGRTTLGFTVKALARRGKLRAEVSERRAQRHRHRAAHEQHVDDRRDD